MTTTPRYGTYWPSKGPINLLFNYNLTLGSKTNAFSGYVTRFYGIRIFGFAIGIFVKKLAEFDEDLRFQWETDHEKTRGSDTPLSSVKEASWDRNPQGAEL